MIKDKLKNLLVPALFLLAILAGALALVLLKEEPKPEEIIKVNAYEGKEKEIVLENDNLKLTMDPATTQFKVKMKSSGKVWYSNPQDAEEDQVALATDIENLKSTLLLTYSTINGVDTLYNNYKYSIAGGIYKIEEADDSIKVNYSIGEVEKEFVVPNVILKDRFEQLLSQMSKSDASMVNQYYKMYDINDLGKKDDKDALLAKYPILADQVIYVLREGVKDNMKTKFEGYFSEAGYTAEEYAKGKELYTADNSTDKPVFNVSVIYRLEGNDLKVEVPMEEIEYKKDYPILTLNVLPYFGAGTASEKGYLLVPEGGGSIINFNNGKTAQNSYYSNVYGWDMAQGRTSLVHETRTYYGVYGISKGDSSFLCMLEDGAAYASIGADISGRSNSYNYVSASFSILHREQCDVADKYNGAMFVYEENIPKETLIERYRFVDSGSYVDMANTYHDYLGETYGERFTANDEPNVPVAVELIGAVDKMEQVMGVPVSKPLVLTSYQDSKKILEELNENGVKNLSVKLSGWMNGGMKQTILSKVKLVSRLGSKKDLKALTSYAAENGMKLYLDGVTNYAYNNKATDDFLLSRDAATYASKVTVKLFPFDPVYYGKQEERDPCYLLNPKATKAMMGNLSEASKAFGAAGVSLRDVGYQLSADYNPRRPVTRQTVKEEQMDAMNSIHDSGTGIMTNMGNDYTLGVTDFITNMDLNGSGYSIIDETIPFYQIALHGYVNYTGEALNLAGDYRRELLKSAEYGAGLFFTFMAADSTELQNTYYSQYFGAGFTSWKETMLAIYARYEKDLGGTFRQRITDHERFDKGITLTTYEDGTKVYVNYNYEDYTTQDGKKLPARDYLVIQ